MEKIVKNQLTAFWAIIFIAFTLRAPITSVGPLASLLCDDLGISNGMVGLLTTLPLLAFAVCSLFIAKIGRKIGLATSILLGLFLLLLGIALRSYAGLWGLFLGTALIGVGIAFGNVLAISFIKQHFPSKSGLLTAIYTCAMAVFAGLAAGLSLPLAQNLSWGWQNTFAFWGILTVVAILFLWPCVKAEKNNREETPQQPTNQKKAASVYRSTLAWQITLFMGLQSLLYYTLVTWLPNICENYGATAADASILALLLQIISIPSSFLAPIWCDRAKDQRKITFGFLLLYLIGMLLFLIPGHRFLLYCSVILLALGSGSTISLALSYMTLRTRDAQTAAEVSGMSQAVGYLLAAIGPACAGFLFDMTHSWSMPILLMALGVVLLMIFGNRAAKANQWIGEEKTGHTKPIKKN